MSSSSPGIQREVPQADVSLTGAEDARHGLVGEVVEGGDGRKESSRLDRDFECEREEEERHAGRQEILPPQYRPVCSAVARLEVRRAVQ